MLLKFKNYSKNKLKININKKKLFIKEYLIEFILNYLLFYIIEKYN